jgi:hypothetical protein
VVSGEWTPLRLSPAAALVVSRDLVGEAPADLLPERGDFEEVLARRRGPAPLAGRAPAALTEPLHEALHPEPSPDAVRAAIHLANLCLTLGEVPRARIGYEAVLSADASNAEALFSLGVCDLQEGNPSSAMVRWRDALTRVEAFERARFREGLERLEGSSPR